MLISSAITAQLICAFVFAYAESRFSHEAALIDCHCCSQVPAKVKYNMTVQLYLTWIDKLNNEKVI